MMPSSSAPFPRSQQFVIPAHPSFFYPYYDFKFPQRSDVILSIEFLVVLFYMHLSFPLGPAFLASIPSSSYSQSHHVFSPRRHSDYPMSHISAPMVGLPRHSSDYHHRDHLHEYRSSNHSQASPHQPRQPRPVPYLGSPPRASSRPYRPYSSYDRPHAHHLSSRSTDRSRPYHQRSWELHRKNARNQTHLVTPSF
jgi:hypothetical protein